VVISISPDAEPEPSRPPTNASLAPASTKSIASYRALIKPLRTDIDINGIRKNISTGMTVQADIKTDRRRIIEFFLSPVLKYLDEGLKLR
jgi:hemolysin D